MGWLYIVIFCLSSIWFFNTFIKIIEKLLNREKKLYPQKR